MRDYVVFCVNGAVRRVAGGAAFGSLVEYLRDDRRLVVTKVGHAEGDCGACTVMIGVSPGRLQPGDRTREPVLLSHERGVRLGSLQLLAHLAGREGPAPSPSPSPSSANGTIEAAEDDNGEDQPRADAR